MPDAINTSALNAAAAASTSAAKPKLTREEKLRNTYDNAVAKITELTKVAQEAATELNAIAALAAVGEGSAVIVTVGKGDTAKAVAGTVTGVKVEEDGSKVYKVQYGSGFDVDVVVVKANKIALPTNEDLTTNDGAELSGQQQAEQETQYS